MSSENLPAPIDSPPEPSIGDRGLAVVRAALGSVPVAGAALQELFAAIVTPPLERRRNDWMESVGEKLVRLEEEHRTQLDSLSDNESFISVVMNATNAALRTHDETKLNALRNAVSNAACSDAPEDSLQLQFVAMVDQLSGWHLRLLEYLCDPTKYIPATHPLWTAPLRDIVPGVEAHIPELGGRRDVILQLYEELYVRRLVLTRNPKVLPGLTALGKRASPLGEALVDYVMRDPTVATAGPTAPQRSPNVVDAAEGRV